MENASKALLMAAEVLIGVLVLSLGVYLFITYSQTSKEIGRRTEEQQVQNFNATYTSYLDKFNPILFSRTAIICKSLLYSTPVETLLGAG